MATQVLRNPEGIEEHITAAAGAYVARTRLRCGHWVSSITLVGPAALARHFRLRAEAGWEPLRKSCVAETTASNSGDLDYDRPVLPYAEFA